MVLCPLIASAQNGNEIIDEFGIVQDPDGWSNVRIEPDGEIVARVDHGELVYLVGSNVKGWEAVVLQPNAKDEREYGFIHASRLRRMSALTKIPGKPKGENELVFTSESVKISIASAPFDSTDAVITKARTEFGGEYISKINGKEVWGTDGGLPRTKYGKFVVEIDDKDASPAAAEIEDLFEPNLNPEWSKAYRDEETGDVFFTALNSDGAGGYVVALKFSKGKLAGRKLLRPF